MSKAVPPLPRRAMIDTGVFIRWVRDKVDADTDACVECVESILLSGGHVMIAAPTLAEVLRWGMATTIPRRRGFSVGAFDEFSARKLGQHFPTSEQQRIAAESGMSHTHIKFDVMIAACAIRYRVETLIAIDGDHHKICKRASFRCVRPHELLPQQVDFKFSD